MGMTIDLAMNNLSGILTEATEDEDSVCYVTEDDAETLQVAIDTMGKYQKIKKIVKDLPDADNDVYLYNAMSKIERILFIDGNID